jgi:NADH-quinone oxidoreductase subunit L
MGFILGMLLLFTATGTLDIQGVLAGLGGVEGWVCTAAALLLFVGACGKSAQIPLYVWLPDAMAGPTPVSALIHAATMVTAGVYVTCRMAPLYEASPMAMGVVAVVGGATALLAATIGVAQTDIKKVLAYSTVSQLGYMMLAAGVGAYGAAMFHLMTHAFFKALLFLGAGSVIHALSGEQDIRKMGGLRQHLPLTHAVFAVAVLAIAGIPPLSGFFSKDEILWAALSGSGGSVFLWVVGVVTAGLTAFYMVRLYLLVFSGRERFPEEVRHHLHEPPPAMTLPLVALAIGSAGAGFAGIPHFLGGDRLPNYFERYLAPVLPEAGGAPHGAASPISEWGALAIALLLSLTGIALAWFLYGRRRAPAPRGAGDTALGRLVRGKFFVDEAIEAVLLRPYRGLCRLAAAFDERVVDGLVNAAGVVTDLASQGARLTTTGYVRNYALVFFLGTVVILYWALR